MRQNQNGSCVIAGAANQQKLSGTAEVFLWSSPFNEQAFSNNAGPVKVFCEPRSPFTPGVLARQAKMPACSDFLLKVVVSDQQC